MNASCYTDKNILVTGGTGSVGSELVRQLLVFRPRVIRVFSRDESKQFHMQHELEAWPNLRFIIGDTRDQRRLFYALEGIHVVFHTASLKHVPACEYNPFEAVQTNIIGLQNLIEGCLQQQVERVVAISTDKAVAPTSTMGATKLLGEKMMASANLYKGARPTVFSNVRFGNVIGSRGSVVPLFIDQAHQGKPVTLTHSAMTRFMVPCPRAVELVLQLTPLLQGGETIILKMPSLLVRDLAEVIAGAAGVGVRVTGIRPGERLHECLMTREESRRALEVEGAYILPPVTAHRGYLFPGAATVRPGAYSSDRAPKMTPENIRGMLAEVGLLLALREESKR